MNKIRAVVSAIESVENLNLVSFNIEHQKMSMISLDLNLPLLVGSEVILGVKANSIALAHEFSEIISISNQLKCKVKSIKKGKLLASVKLSFAHDCIIESIITLESALRMDLKIGDVVIALIKANEVSVLELLQ